MNRRHFGRLAANGLAAFVLPIAIQGLRPAYSAEMEQTMAFYARSSTDRGLRFLREKQKRDGSWEGGITNMAMALHAFVTSYQRYNSGDGPFITKPTSHLVEVVDAQVSAQDQAISIRDVAQSAIALRVVNDPANDGLILTAQRALARQSLDSIDPEVIDRQIDLYLVLTALRGSQADGVGDFRATAHELIAELQLPTGGFPGPDGNESFAMTCAGAASLAAALQADGDGALEAALRRIVSTYSVDPAAMRPGEPVFFLYDALIPAMKRAEREAEDGDLGEAGNWRDTMAYSLIQQQHDDGGWLPDASAADRVAATARAVSAMNEALS